jgi:glucose-1-phosphatase
MERISVVLFDLDGVLCTYDRVAHIARIADLAGKKPDDVYEAIWASGFDGQADAGLFDANAYLQGFATRVGYPLTRAEWLTGRKATTTPNHEVLELVRLIKRPSKIAILTNNTTLVTEYLDDLLPEIRPLFGDNIYASAMLKDVKPNVGVFFRCLEKIRAVPHRSVFVDDQQNNIDGARRAGLHGHHYSSPKLLATLLATHGLL